MRHPRKKPKKRAEEYLTTAEGERIAVGDMTRDHARNALRVLLRRCREMMEELDNDCGVGFGDYEFWK